MKTAFWRAADRLSEGLGITGALVRRRLARPRKLALCYHRIAETPDHLCAPGLVLRPRDLAAQLAYLGRWMTGLGSEEFLAYRGPAPVFTVTFDDGFADNRTEAVPVLKSLGLTAAFFVCPHYIRAPRVFWQNEMRTLAGLMEPRGGGAGDDPRALRDALRAANLEDRESLLTRYRARLGVAAPAPAPASLMNAADLVALKAEGMAVFSHTNTHAYLSALPREEVVAELVKGHQDLEALLGETVPRIVAYPFGTEEALPRDLDAIMEESGFEAGFMVRPAFHEPSRDGRFRIPRLAVDRDDGLARFRLRKMLPLVIASRS